MASMIVRDARTAGGERPQQARATGVAFLIDAMHRYAIRIAAAVLLGLALGALSWLLTHRHDTARATLFVDAATRYGTQAFDGATALAREAALLESLAQTSPPQALQVAIDNDRRLLRVTLTADSAEAHLQELLDAYVAARARTAAGVEVSVVRPPQKVPNAPDAFLPWMATAGLAGLLAGIIGAAVAAARDHSLRSASALARAANVATVLTTPPLSSEHLFILRPRDLRPGEPDVASFEAALHAMSGTDYIGARAFQQSVLRLLARLRARAKPGRPHAVLLAAPKRGTGNTTLAIALAEAGALAGERVLLIDATIADPAPRSGNGARPETQGIVDADVDRDALGAMIERGEPASFAMLPLAESRIIGRDLAHRRRLAATLNALMQDFDLIIIDAGGVTEDETAAALSPIADQIWIVARFAVTLPHDVAVIEDLLIPVRDRIAGAVLTMTPQR